MDGSPKRGLVVMLAGISLAVAGYARTGGYAAEPRNAVTVFGARMTDNGWRQIVELNHVEFHDSYLVGLAVSRELIGREPWALELEGQAVHHVGNNDHGEFNVAGIARWRAFPWNEWLRTSIACGAGVSLATSVPNEEEMRSGESAEFMLYGMLEVEAGRPRSLWSGVVRVHHRSTGNGLLASDGGSNFVALGIRRRF